MPYPRHLGVNHTSTLGYILKDLGLIMARLTNAIQEGRKSIIKIGNNGVMSNLLKTIQLYSLLALFPYL